uniref:Uncharacterized protein n=1 Tax=Medicago truncatula TaxID=3880 RepID=Q2HW97_MEDTR|nr:hypothetical protein MtrDRAFT_AC147482g50v2 [Medicago truncatula]
MVVVIKDIYVSPWISRGGATTRRPPALARTQSILSLYLAQPNSPLIHLKKIGKCYIDTF